MNKSRAHELDLHRMISVYTSTISVLEQSIVALQTELRFLSEERTVENGPSSNTPLEFPIVDRGRLSVFYRDRSCLLGNTLMLRFMDLLIRRPNYYFPHSELLRCVWEAHRDLSSLRSVVKDLRAKLRTAGLGDVARAIDGRMRGHFAFLTARLG